MSALGRQQTPSSEVWASAIGKSVSLNFQNPAADHAASSGPTPGHISYAPLGRRVEELRVGRRRENVTRVFSTAAVRGDALRRPECAQSGISVKSFG
jgi:hypothetical protein